ncbi:transposase [Gemmata sp. JC717]|uniref:transposase n=1 Tax=Gemmata algarum TaxID=2975278 RepID=UPI0021BB924B|nr:transposase [Gemmata algarum]MDY3554889.1 transposase [Gemmata algarum]
MVPTLTAALGVKGHRPAVGTRDNEHLPHVLAVMSVVTAARHANTLDSPKGAKARTGLGKARRMQAAFAAHLRHVARVHPAARHPRVVLAIDNAPWHRGEVVDEALAENLHLGLYRLPGYSPCLNPVEQFWRKLRRRATHNRLFDSPADLKRSVRNSLCYVRTVRERVATLVRGCYPAPLNATGLPNS